MVVQYTLNMCPGFCPSNKIKQNLFQQFITDVKLFIFDTWSHYVTLIDLVCISGWSQETHLTLPPKV